MKTVPTTMRVFGNKMPLGGSSLGPPLGFGGLGASAKLLRNCINRVGVRHGRGLTVERRDQRRPAFIDDIEK